MVRRRDSVHSEGCPSARLLVSTSQIVQEITNFATLAERGDCCEALSLINNVLGVHLGVILKNKMCIVEG